MAVATGPLEEKRMRTWASVLLVFCTATHNSKTLEENVTFFKL